jgi:aminoglycoside 3-N-acetyltransferase I
MNPQASREASLRRLGAGDRELARELFRTMADVFEDGAKPLTDGYLDRLLAREEFWALAALVDNEVVGGLTAHVLPMTRSETLEVFLYDLAVKPEYQRRGIGRRLVQHLLDSAEQAGFETVFVPADNEDEGALEFYRAMGGEAAAVTIFTWPGQE